jgi:hypothetical protein
LKTCQGNIPYITKPAESIYKSLHHSEGLHPNILTQMGAIDPVSAINRMVIRELNIILLMSAKVIAVCIFAPVSALFRQPNSTLSLIRE